MGTPRNEQSTDNDTFPEPRSLKSDPSAPVSNTQPLQADAATASEQGLPVHEAVNLKLSAGETVAEPQETPTETPALSSANAIDSVPILEDGTNVALPVTEEPAPIGLAGTVQGLSQQENGTTITAVSDPNDTHEAVAPSTAVNQRKNSGKSRRSTGDSAKLVVNASVKAINTAATKVISFAASPFKKRGRPDKPTVAVNQQNKGKAPKASPPPPPQPQKPAKDTKTPVEKPTATKKK